ncbi:MAG: sulfurtransferase [Dehalococcoidia bacterium]
MRYSLRWGVLLAALVFFGAMGTVSAEAPEDSADPSLLISTDRLQSLLSNLDIRIIDLRAPEKFQEGHIPYALSLPARAVLDSASRIEGARRGDAELTRMFGRLGIGKETHVVLYDDKGGHQAARILWILHYLGHQKVSVLDGGLPKWQEEGRHITQQTRQVKREYFPMDLTPRRLATADWILDHMRDPDLVIIDVRPPEKYVESHIPGAINIPWKKNLNADETWKRPEELRALYESSGVTKDKKIVVYCQGGNHNAHTYLTLKALGYPRVRSYDRAWPEWGSDPSLPKSVGLAPGSGDAGDRDREQEMGGPQQAEQGKQQEGHELQQVAEARGTSRLNVVGMIGPIGLILALMGIMVAVIWRIFRH